LYPIVKHIHRIFFEEGTALSRMAITQSSDELFAQAEEKYKVTIQVTFKSKLQGIATIKAE
jgi:hypothetical protein